VLEDRRKDLAQYRRCREVDFALDTEHRYVRMMLVGGEDGLLHRTCAAWFPGNGSSSVSGVRPRNVRLGNSRRSGSLAPGEPG
jgi:hypothetical protein